MSRSRKPVRSSGRLASRSTISYSHWRRYGTSRSKTGLGPLQYSRNGSDTVPRDGPRRLARSRTTIARRPGRAWYRVRTRPDHPRSWLQDSGGPRSGPGFRYPVLFMPGLSGDRCCGHLLRDDRRLRPGDAEPAGQFPLGQRLPGLDRPLQRHPGRGVPRRWRVRFPSASATSTNADPVLAREALPARSLAPIGLDGETAGPRT